MLRINFSGYGGVFPSPRVWAASKLAWILVRHAWRVTRSGTMKTNRVSRLLQGFPIGIPASFLTSIQLTGVTPESPSLAIEGAAPDVNAS